ncbi:hypothetical protein J437_LFUL014940 [Ladona fulva]|uniref:Uncharacterized protein n=1 Tax=Ladona fulva TaxID=123851 RepID=A0A8K0KK10_LADFU|nr:hypothetical protein J437_LFUL014940 [Ladona fulva]
MFPPELTHFADYYGLGEHTFDIRVQIRSPWVAYTILPGVYESFTALITETLSQYKLESRRRISYDLQHAAFILHKYRDLTEKDTSRIDEIEPPLEPSPAYTRDPNAPKPNELEKSTTTWVYKSLTNDLRIITNDIKRLGAAVAELSDHLKSDSHPTRNIFVYTIIIQPLSFGDSLSRCLRIVDVGNKNHHIFHVPYYITVERAELERIEILLTDGEGVPLTFSNNDTPSLLVLHFIRVSQ